MTGVRRLLFVLLLISILSVPAIGTAQAAPLDQGSVHVVEAGDSLSAIAQQYGVSLRAIMSANNISNSSLIYPGQRLVIPGTDAPSSVPADTAVHVVASGETLSAIRPWSKPTASPMLHASSPASG